MKRETNINIRITPEERQLFKDAAVARGFDDMSKFLRWCGITEAKVVLNKGEKNDKAVEEK